MTTHEKVQYWLDLATTDLGAAKAMLKSKYYLHVGFMCHLTIEKALKAAITHFTDEIPPKIHQLVKLAVKSGIHDKMSEEYRETLRRLNPLNIEGRYPEYKEGISQTLDNNKCVQLIERTEELLCWINQQLSPPCEDIQTK